MHYKSEKLIVFVSLLFLFFFLCGCTLTKSIYTDQTEGQGNKDSVTSSNGVVVIPRLTQDSFSTSSPKTETDLPDSLDKSSVSSIFRWLDYAIQHDDADAIAKLGAEEIAYVGNLAGGDWNAKERFLNDFSQRNNSNPVCIGKGTAEDGYMFVAWYEGWDPLWVLNRSCSDQCYPIDPPVTSDIIGFLFSRDNGSYSFEKVWINDPKQLVQIYPTLMESCENDQQETLSNINPGMKGSSSCEGAPEQRMIVGKSGSVCTKFDGIYLRKNPSRSGEILLRIETGTRFEVIDGPICSDNWSWWKVRITTGDIGWVSEGGDSIDPYFLCP